MKNEPDKLFAEWIAKFDEDQAISECGKSYYDSDTGLTDYESARYDEMKAAFNAGFDAGFVKLQREYK